MPLYRTWAVTSEREPLSLPHSLSSPLLLKRLHSGSTSFFPLHAPGPTLPSAPLRPFRLGLSASFVRSAPLRPLYAWSSETANNRDRSRRCVGSCRFFDKHCRVCSHRRACSRCRDGNHRPTCGLWCIGPDHCSWVGFPHNI